MLSLRLAVCALVVLAVAASNKKCPHNECAVRVKVTFTTLAPQMATFQTPVWVGFHDGTFDLYDRDVSLDGFGMESLVEDGDTAELTARFASEARTGQDATLMGRDGPIVSGETVTEYFDVDPVYQRYFSYASMVIPSNDAFIANGNPLAFEIFDEYGSFQPVDNTVVGTMVLDGGVEVNDELEATTAALGQTVPNTGTDENGVVVSHVGFLRNGRILTARPNGDFLAPGYEVARFTVELVKDSCGKNKYCRVASKGSCYYSVCKKDGGSKTTAGPATTTKGRSSRRRRRRRSRRRRRRSRRRRRRRRD